MFKQIELNYDALEPVIDKETIGYHYGKHHAAYAKNFNDAAEKAGVADKDVEWILANLDAIEDEALRKALRNNGGGFYNHNLYFGTLCPGGTKPTPGFLNKIGETFGGLEELQNQLAVLAAGQFGSGWAWLSCDSEGNLYTSCSPNQDNPIIEGKGWVPILAIDVWEHAYYLQYKNLRPDYIKALFDIIDWEAVEEIYDRVSGK